MKKILFLLAVICCVACSTNYNEPTSPTESSNVSTRSIQFIIKGLNVDYATKSPKRISTATITTEGITDLWVFEGNTLLTHQTSTDPNFGNPTVSLKIGAHDLTFIASKSEGQSFDNGLWSCTKVKDTFGTVLAYTVSKSSSSKQVELKRINGKVQWTIEDAIPSDVTTAEISISQCYALDKDLNGSNQINFEPSFNISSYVGVSGMVLSILVFPTNHTEGSTISPSIKILAGKTVLCNYITDCTVKSNITTNIHGSFFSIPNQQMVSLNTTWGDPQNVAL